MKIFKKIIFLIFLLMGHSYTMNVITIPTIKLRGGESTEVNFDYFVDTSNDRMKIRILDVGKGIKVKTITEKRISITADTEFEGFTTVKAEVSSLNKDRCDIVLLCRVEKPSTVMFKFKPKQYVKEISVAGEFNSWNPNVHKLKGPDSDGYYKISIEIPDGEYQYKFVIDGKKWVEDPENQKKVPDGFGGYNSVITVDTGKTGKFIPITKKRVKEGLEFVLRYIPENDDEIDENSIVIKVNNYILQDEHFRFDTKDGKLYIILPGDKKEQCYNIYINAMTKRKKLVPEYHFCEYVDEKIFNWRDAVIYFVFTDRFCNGNKTNDNPVNDPEVADIANYLGGDFAGIIKKIEEGYFQKLGVNTLWISPVVKNPDKAYRDALPPHRKFTGYHGYWPVSLTEVEPRFGTMQDLQRLVQVTHQHGLKVIFDMVLNHVHEENPLYKEKPYWFGQLLLPDGRKNIRLFDERPIDTWFDEFLPSFDYEKNPDAVDFMVNNCIWWIKQTNCDGFRLDAVKHIPHKFWYKLRLKLRQEVEFVNNKKFYLVGETISSREKIMEYINPYELDGQFDFPLYWAIRDVFGYNSAGFTKLEKERMRSEKIFGVSYAIMSVFLGNHDFARFISYADGDIKPTTNEKELAWTAPPKVENKDSYKKAQLAFVFVLTQSAIPLIYYGDEIGLAGAGDPDNRRMMKFENLTKDERKLLEFVSHLLKLRKEHPALRYGIHHTIYVSDEIYVYIKKYFDDEVIVVLNKSKQKQKIEFEIPEWIVIKSRIFKDRISSKKIELSNGRKLKLLVPALSSVILCSK